MSDTSKLTDVRECVDFVCDLAHRHLDADTVRRAKKRQGAVLSWQDADYLPLLFGKAVPEMDRLPSYDWREQWYDPAKSFVEQMKGVVANAAARSDSVPAIRADTGVVNGPCLFGAEITVPHHTKPVVTGHPPKGSLAEFALPDDIASLGITPRIIEHTEHHLKVLRTHGLGQLVGVHHCDTQGPFDIAAQTRGHDIFTDFYDDPPFVHRLLGQCVRAYVALSRLCKKLQGEGETWGNASGYWMDRGGVRMCDDSGILLPANLYEEFVLPYQAKGLEPFVAGWLHYCGGVPGGGRPEGLHLHDLYCRIPFLRGLNFTTGHDLIAEIKKLLSREVAFIGNIPREKDETLKSHFHRAIRICPGRKGMILHGEVKPEEVDEAMEVWQVTQDEILP